MKLLFILAYHVTQVVLLIASAVAAVLAPPLLLTRAIRYIWNPHPGPIGGFITITLIFVWIAALAVLSVWLMMRKRRPT